MFHKVFVDFKMRVESDIEKLLTKSESVDKLSLTNSLTATFESLQKMISYLQSSTKIVVETNRRDSTLLRLSSSYRLLQHFLIAVVTFTQTHRYRYTQWTRQQRDISSKEKNSLQEITFQSL
jgi:hypothetical protein